MLRILVFSCLACGTAAVPLRAAIIDTSTVIDAENSFPNETVEVIDGATPPTIVDILDGAVIGSRNVEQGLVARGSSIINLWGGIIRGADEPIVLRDNSELRVRGQTNDFETPLARTYDSTRVSIPTGGAFARIEGFGNSHVDVRGGLVRTVLLFDDSTARLEDADWPDERVYAVARDRSRLTILGGSYDEVGGSDDANVWFNAPSSTFAGVRDRARFHWTGGSRFGEGFWIHDDAELHLYGKELEYYIDDDLGPSVRGIHRDGQRFYARVFMSGNGHIVMHTAPEPCSVGLVLVSATLLAVPLAMRRPMCRQIVAA